MMNTMLISGHGGGWAGEVEDVAIAGSLVQGSEVVGIMTTGCVVRSREQGQSPLSELGAADRN